MMPGLRSLAALRQSLLTRLHRQAWARARLLAAHRVLASVRHHSG
jgi:hypothetical protein